MRLAPIEKPKSFLVRYYYWVLRRMFGKVIMPAKVVYSRKPSLFFLPAHFLMIEKGLTISDELHLLISAYVSHINGCSFCLDMSKYRAEQKKLTVTKFRSLHHFRDSEIFTASDKAALNYTEEVIKTKRPSDETFAALQVHFSEKEIVEITWTCAVENYYNTLALPLGISSDELCSI